MMGEYIEVSGSFLQNGGGKEASMATLNIKNFPDPLYEKLQERAQQEHRSLAQEVIHILHQTMDRGERVSILELEGLGKELWEGIDAAEYVRRERDSWDS
jgi:plasmid stability protein